MIRRRWWQFAAVVALLIGGVALWQVAESESEHLAGAELLANGGDVSLLDVVYGRVEDVSLDDVPVPSASALVAGNDDAFYVLFEEALEGGLVEATTNGRIERAGTVHVGVPGSPVPIGQRVTSIAIGPDGQMAVAGEEVLLRGFNWTGDEALQPRFPVGAMAWTDDGRVLLGSGAGPVIDVFDRDGAVRRLLGPPGDGAAEVRTDEPVGSIVSLVALPDERVAFVAESTDGYQLSVLDGAGVRLIEDGVGDLDGTRPADETVRADRYPMQPLAPGPDGRVLTTGLGPGGDPQISLVDLDTGEVEVLAELEGVEPSVEEPVSAAAVGDDLIFLADGRLWKLDGAFG